MSEPFPNVPKGEGSPEWGFRYERTVSPDLVDSDNGHLGYLGFVKIFEEAQRALQVGRGLTHAATLERFKVRLVVKAIQIEYDGEVLPNESVQVFTKALLPGDTSVTYHQAILNDKNQKVASCDFTLVAMGDDKKPQTIPGAMREALTTMNDYRPNAGKE